MNTFRKLVFTIYLSCVVAALSPALALADYCSDWSAACTGPHQGSSQSTLMWLRGCGLSWRFYCDAG